MSAALDVLKERGFVYDASDMEALDRALEQPLTLYSGFDPTGPSLHTGHLVPIMAMRHLQKHGHRPIALVGGGTARIGDPSGKTSSRPMLSGEAIDGNAARVATQLSRYLDFTGGRALLMDNKSWLGELQVIPFLREVGRHFSVNQMLSAEVYKTRLEGGLSFLEFNYMLLQAYDFLYLFRTEQCLLYVGGSDQWSNSLAGVDLIRRAETAQAFTLVSPLLTTASGQKMGKTEKGAVYLDAQMTSPFEYYQFWINIDDINVKTCLGLYTELPLEQVHEFAALRGAEIRKAKELLAFEATKLAHGEAEASDARDRSQALFGGQPDTEAAPTCAIPATELENLDAAKLFVLAGLCESRNAARRLMEQGGASIEGVKVSSPDSILDPDMVRKGALLKAGKKRFTRVTVEGE